MMVAENVINDVNDDAFVSRVRCELQYAEQEIDILQGEA